METSVTTDPKSAMQDLQRRMAEANPGLQFTMQTPDYARWPGTDEPQYPDPHSAEFQRADANARAIGRLLAWAAIACACAAAWCLLGPAK